MPKLLEKNVFLLLALLFAISSCTIVQKAPKHKPYLFKNNYEVKGGNFSKSEKSTFVTRMENQLEDSSNISEKTFLFFITINNKPPVFDTSWAALSARNMQSAMLHYGYYKPNVSYRADTNSRKVSVTYTLVPGKLTTIDTMAYNLQNTGLDSLVKKSLGSRLIVEGKPISKTAIIAEEGRLVDTFRNNGYYKFTAADLLMLGDTTVSALTQVSDDPFEQIRLLAEAQALRDSPKIRLQMVLQKPSDSINLVKFRIGDIYILKDYKPGDNLSDTSSITQRSGRNFIVRYKENKYRTSFIGRNILFRKGEVYSQKNYNQTLTNLARTGVFDNVNITVLERREDSLLDMVVELIPGKKFGFEAALEGSYSAVSNTNNALAGNLFGLSANFSLTNRNLNREAIKMRHSLRAGIEFNNKNRSNTASLINSNELSYTNSVTIPRIIWPFANVFSQRKVATGESFFNGSASINNRFGLFNMQNYSLNTGFSWIAKKERKYYIRPMNIEFNYLYNESDSFIQVILPTYPFLKYTYNTALVMGMGAGYSSIYRNPNHPKSNSKERTFKLNTEESGLTFGALPILTKYKRKYFKTDVEFKYTVSYDQDRAIVLRAFTGIGIPVGKDSINQQLPFFKQYFGGGSNSMRGWPVRGIGRGGQKLASYSDNLFNDRTGDMQLELNAEYRYKIATIIQNTLTLRGAVFADVGNVWNFKSDTTVANNAAQFKFQNLYKQMGMSVGTGFRLDFNYFIFRADLGLRLKRPETSDVKNGWNSPDLSNIFRKVFSAKEEYRLWRYNNFNFTIGISYPF